ncbi:perlucin-like isoform X1 [Mytilus galloprovincialis]|uniref:perlucin-like isoform X1 n=1 Tax=Mytilus galloprovincialis TaxID=29158 RepID=UPI003F7CCF18
MENLFVILLLSVVVLLSALYGYTVEQKIKKEIKDEIKEEGEFVKLVNAEIELKKEMKKVKDELEDVKSQLQEKDKAYRNEIYQIKQNMTVLLKETSIRYDNALQDLKKEITSKEKTSTAAGALRSCNIGWIRENNSCYHFSRFATNFYTALSFCKTIGGKLIEIDDQSEWDMIQRHAKNLSFPDFYIGVTDLFSEGDWLKATTLERQNYLIWMNMQPDNFNNNQHCVQVRTSQMVFSFNDFFCDYDRHFVCEK